jgi:hypothetical protein
MQKRGLILLLRQHWQAGLLHLGLQNSLKQTTPFIWFFYDNSGSEPCLIAYGEKEQELLVNDSAIWHNIKKKYGSKRKT